ncbi:MAG: hypothetical protein JW727_02415 [Candidatus Aenigmarchaeota archaeon]|nr:hypothetical protein [Candidatus Aenigmarchaeota archaeon]
MYDYLIDTHLHTPASDGHSDYAEILRVASSRGLSALAVTDHGTMAGVGPMQALAGDFEVEIVPGIEINSGQMHVVGLGVCEPVPNGLGIEKTFHEIDAQDGLIIIAHPTNGRQIYLSEVAGLLDSYFVGVECMGIHGGYGVPYKFGNAFKFCKQYGLPRIGCTDAHRANHVGLIATVCGGESFSDFRRAFESAKTDIWVSRYS